MDDDNRISQLEKALLDQAETLARERIEHAQTARAHILAESAERLREREQKLLEAVRAEADNLIRRRVQAAHGRMTAELDRLRWTLTEATLADVRLALAELVRDPGRYLPVLEGFLAAAARQLPAGDLVAEVNGADLNLLASHWDALCQRAAPGRRIELTGHGRNSLGGICLRLADNRARVDQTFEARQDRLAEDLARVVMERMFAGPSELGA